LEWTLLGARNLLGQEEGGSSGEEEEAADEESEQEEEESEEEVSSEDDDEDAYYDDEDELERGSSASEDDESSEDEDGSAESMYGCIDLEGLPRWGPAWARLGWALLGQAEVGAGLVELVRQQSSVVIGMQCEMRGSCRSQARQVALCTACCCFPAATWRFHSFRPSPRSPPCCRCANDAEFEQVAAIMRGEAEPSPARQGSRRG